VRSGCVHGGPGFIRVRRDRPRVRPD
jgi:hypothetical protein